MTERALITDEELHAFIDGELDALRAADVAVLLQYHPELQARVAAFRADKAMLATTYGSLIDQPVPAAWHGIIARGRAPRQFAISRRGVFAAAASVAGAAILGWQGYVQFAAHDEDRLIREAMAARSESDNMALASGGDRSDVDGALKTALGLQVRSPDLSKFGFELARYHVSTGVPGGRAVVLEYQDSDRRLFTVYLRHSTGDERFDMTKRGAVRVCVWQDDVLSAVMLADMSAGEMLRLATLAYAGLSA